MKPWNPVPWLREMQATLDPDVDVRPGMAADRIEVLEAALRGLLAQAPGLDHGAFRDNSQVGMTVLFRDLVSAQAALRK